MDKEELYEEFEFLELSDRAKPILKANHSLLHFWIVAGAILGFPWRYRYHAFKDADNPGLLEPTLEDDAASPPPTKAKQNLLMNWLNSKSISPVKTEKDSSESCKKKKSSPKVLFQGNSQEDSTTVPENEDDDSSDFKEPDSPSEVDLEEFFETESKVIQPEDEVSYMDEDDKDEGSLSDPEISSRKDSGEEDDDGAG